MIDEGMEMRMRQECEVAFLWEIGLFWQSIGVLGEKVLYYCLSLTMIGPLTCGVFCFFPTGVGSSQGSFFFLFLPVRCTRNACQINGGGQYVDLEEGGSEKTHFCNLIQL